ncbi:nucleoside-diphosphate sugar epimerase [Lysinibacillus capsici]|uniref:nucleoside-diphosphate sugar epimerase n=1 Tax=Lysinibacillus capsici TaxID=2115968 RepID=UPI0028AA4943|nr:nucleoside-diphosphate sugar epimerase [Lysinibacillus capsici]
MNKDKKKEIKELKKVALVDLNLLKKEFEQIKLKASKKKNRELEELGLLGDYELEDLYVKRKDRKYASLTVELYALVEQLLKDIYKVINPNDNYRNHSKENIIIDLEKKLGGKMKFDNNTQLLANLRSHIVHEEFSFKQAKIKYKEDSNSNKELFKNLLKDVEHYIRKIKIK